jgi:signal transduction histidine kinase
MDGAPRVVRAVNRIDRNVVRCDRIIDELLDFTRISQLQPEVTPLNAWLEVIFEDTGSGMPPDVYERIFEPLYSTKGFGAGLGLPVVKQIMEQHGGGIEIESEPGRGTRVCLWLPNGPASHGSRVY